MRSILFIFLFAVMNCAFVGCSSPSIEDKKITTGPCGMVDLQNVSQSVMDKTYGKMIHHLFRALIVDLSAGKQFSLCVYENGKIQSGQQFFGQATTNRNFAIWRKMSLQELEALLTNLKNAGIERVPVSSEPSTDTKEVSVYWKNWLFLDQRSLPRGLKTVDSEKIEQIIYDLIKRYKLDQPEENDYIKK